jgi:hypothetical protein
MATSASGHRPSLPLSSASRDARMITKYRWSISHAFSAYLASDHLTA